MCDPKLGLIGPGGTVAAATSDAAPTTLDPKVLDSLCDDEEAAYMQQVEVSGGASEGLQDPALQSVCALVQLTPSANAADFALVGSCAGSKDPGWCYVTGAAAGVCAQTIVFTANEPPHGATIGLQCTKPSPSAAGWLLCCTGTHDSRQTSTSWWT